MEKYYIKTDNGLLSVTAKQAKEIEKKNQKLLKQAKKDITILKDCLFLFSDNIVKLGDAK